MSQTSFSKRFDTFCLELLARATDDGRTVEDCCNWLREYLHANPEVSGSEYRTQRVLLTLEWGMAQAVRAGGRPTDYLLELIASRAPGDYDTEIPFPPELEAKIADELAAAAKNWTFDEVASEYRIPEEHRRPLEIVLIPAGTPGYPAQKVAYLSPTLNGFWTRRIPNDPVAADTKAVALRADMDALPTGDDPSLPYTSRSTTPDGASVAHACGHDEHIMTEMLSSIFIDEWVCAYPDELHGVIGSIRDAAEEAPVVIRSEEGTQPNIVAEPEPMSGALHLVRLGAIDDVGATIGGHNMSTAAGVKASPGEWLTVDGGINAGAVLSRTKVVISGRDAALRAHRATVTAGHIIDETWDYAAGLAQITRLGLVLTRPLERMAERAADKGNAEGSKRWLDRRIGVQDALQRYLAPPARYLRRVPLLRRRLDAKIVAAPARVTYDVGETETYVNVVGTPRYYYPMTGEIMGVLEEAHVRAADSAPVEPVFNRGATWMDFCFALDGERGHGSRPHHIVNAAGAIGHVITRFDDVLSAALDAAVLARRITRRSARAAALARVLSPALRLRRKARRLVGSRPVSRVRWQGVTTAGMDEAVGTMNPPNVIPGRSIAAFAADTAGLPRPVARQVIDTAMVSMVESWVRRVPNQTKAAGRIPKLRLWRSWVNRYAYADQIDHEPSRRTVTVDQQVATTPVLNAPRLNKHVTAVATSFGVKVGPATRSPGGDSIGANSGDDGTSNAQPIDLYYATRVRVGPDIHAEGLDVSLNVRDAMVYAAIALTAHQNPELGLKGRKESDYRPFSDQVLAGMKRVTVTNLDSTKPAVRLLA